MGDINNTTTTTDNNSINNSSSTTISSTTNGEELNIVLKKDESPEQKQQQQQSSSSIPSAIKDTKKKQRNNRVSFDQIHIREYFIELGDNPSCSRGPPLTIGWVYDEVGSVELEEFEEYRPPRRCGSQMIVPFRKREEILEFIGYTPTEIRIAVQDVNVSRNLRIKTVQRVKHDKVDAVVESANRKLKKLFIRKKS